MGNIMRNISITVAATLACCLLCAPATAANWLQGHISEITYTGDALMVRLGNGVTDNCASSPGGWMIVPATSKPMQAYLTGLWLSGSAPHTQVVVYTDAPTSSGGYCSISQIQPLA